MICSVTHDIGDALILTGCDIETTGLEQSAGHRIIEIAFVHFDFDSRKKVGEYVRRIDPRRPIDPKSEAVHGISLSMLSGQPVWEDVAGEVAAEMVKGGLLIAHNMDFDGPFIAGELIRVGVPLPTVSSFCTMENGRWACFDGKFPKLQELCFSLDVDYDPTKAHGASYDVEVMLECYFKAMDRGFFPSPV